jgi:hypothetical protein
LQVEAGQADSAIARSISARTVIESPARPRGGTNFSRPSGWTPTSPRTGCDTSRGCTANTGSRAARPRRRRSSASGCCGVLSERWRSRHYRQAADERGQDQLLHGYPSRTSMGRSGSDQQLQCDEGRTRRDEQRMRAFTTIVATEHTTIPSVPEKGLGHGERSTFG